MSDRLTALRRIMAEKNLSAYIQPGSDAHQSEYVGDYWRTRHWLSGFTGSNGIVVVTEKEAGLWTDGRYFIQAEKELAGSGIKLFKMDEPGVPAYSQWLADNLPIGAKIGFDGRVVSISEFRALKDILSGKEISYHYIEDIVGSLWEDRPAFPAAPAFIHDLAFAGKSSVVKLSEVRKKMQEEGADLYLAAALDDIAWLCNIRGSDITNTPVVFAYLLVSMESAYLFIDENKVSAALTAHLEEITICPYGAVYDYVREKADSSTLLYHAEGISVSLFDAVPGTAKAVNTSSIIQELKAVKNETEINNARNAFTKEGVVMVKFLKWLAQLKGDMPNETDVQAEISRLRRAQAHCLGDSFTTIAAYGKNASSPHYSPKAEDCSRLKPEGLMLVDTGGQYLDGTTDITRTFVMGPISDEMKRDFTLVLKGHIALAQAKFLKGATGAHLDVLARQYLWKAGMDYKHGTGHGLGYCLGVHEGPQNISMRINPNKLLPGMFCTNEPGIYKEGRHGIRSENVMLIKELETTEFGVFLGFEPLTLCPFDTRAVDRDLLTKSEIDYLNGYHCQVYEKLTPFLDKAEREWLKEATRAM